ncbi:secondary thiamine-phosphate synthase enzyme [Paucidesulfovibrio gracilis DSM 16080]|uniref:Secondary thiamine-phosphate synthase enzyme n=1 Tax=Paucidesulfovibrio gracilis DSM 16080 TaxID=1121449 RepID=A0A1T4XFH1_9BACT|nr:secondary thiamine-phosphate synthase enzyme YjbQ [Paucidesulfovibrio gracilis]SKA88219.1 secondary thiamine-phosphate synthase enzyme [Paucidesulfovibrio gracilis DSM 16080]
MDRLLVDTSSREQMVNITTPTQGLVSQRGWHDGVLTLFCPHTSAAVVLSEGNDPAVGTDLLRNLSRLLPRDAGYIHPGNPDAHLKSIMVGQSVQILVEQGCLLLGSWQGVFFCEFDGPRPREVWVKFKA